MSATTEISKMTAMDWLLYQNSAQIADLKAQAAKELRALAERATRAAESFDQGDTSPWDLAFITGQTVEIHDTVRKLATLKEQDAKLRQVIENDRCQACGELTHGGAR